MAPPMTPSTLPSCMAHALCMRASRDTEVRCAKESRRPVEHSLSSVTLMAAMISRKYRGSSTSGIRDLSLS